MLVGQVYLNVNQGAMTVYDALDVLSFRFCQNTKAYRACHRWGWW
jgi:hypothetical protein